MNFESFQQSIPNIQQADLGGRPAQFLLAPQFRQAYEVEEIKKFNPKLAAVLLLLFPDEKNSMRMLLTKRPDYQGHHANQISFTGGKYQESDASLFHTAIRETYEEVKVSVTPENLVKKLTEVYIPPSNFLVQPYLCLLAKMPLFTPNYEVMHVLTPSLQDILYPKIEQQKILTTNGVTVKTPGFSIEQEFVWGATAMILSELRDLLLRSGQ